MTAALWVAGARPRTLPAAVVPVAVGTSIAGVQGSVLPWRAVAALIVALAIQVGTNYANDYSDGLRGTDQARVGPARLVGGGLASPGAVRLAAFASFAVAAVAGLALAAAVTWWLLVVGATALLAGWFYTGGPRPYGYAGWGEVFVFVFFGLVATVGSAYVHLQEVTLLALGAAIPVGALSCALLVVNNLRDIAPDTAAGKRTLAVRMGDPDTRALYLALITVVPVGATLLIGLRRPAALIALLGGLFAVRPLRAVRQGARGRDLIAVLQDTARLQLVYGSLLSAGILWA